jgi:hypothetical protein
VSSCMVSGPFPRRLDESRGFGQAQVEPAETQRHSWTLLASAGDDAEADREVRVAKHRIVDDRSQLMGAHGKRTWR